MTWVRNRLVWLDLEPISTPLGSVRNRGPGPISLRSGTNFGLVWDRSRFSLVQFGSVRFGLGRFGAGRFGSVLNRFGCRSVRLRPARFDKLTFGSRFGIYAGIGYIKGSNPRNRSFFLDT